MISELLKDVAAELTATGRQREITEEDLGKALSRFYSGALALSARRLNAALKSRGQILPTDVLATLAPQAISGVCRAKMPDGSECGESLWVERHDDGRVEYVCPNDHRTPA